MASFAQENTTRRASCDKCRQKKVKCDGVYPVCGRCLSVGEECQYSAKLPMGRPKKRKLGLDGQDGEGSTTHESPLSATDRDHHSDSGRVAELTNSLITALALPDAVIDGTDATQWACELSPVSQSDPVLEETTATSTKHPCACLATLYLCLDEMRTTDSLSFTSALALIRNATVKAIPIIQCRICPTKFIWAMQNTQLTNTLILSIAEAYQRLVNSLETEAHRAAEASEPKSLWFGEGDLRDSGFPTFQLAMSPSEWLALVKKSVRAEIFGETNMSLTSFCTVLQLMEDRQIAWHAGIPPAHLQCHQHNHHDVEPACVVLVRQARNMVTTLSLEA